MMDINGSASVIRSNLPSYSSLGNINGLQGQARIGAAITSGYYFHDAISTGVFHVPHQHAHSDEVQYKISTSLVTVGKLENNQIIGLSID
jgi:hypothetical protein